MSVTVDTSNWIRRVDNIIQRVDDETDRGVEEATVFLRDKVRSVKHPGKIAGKLRSDPEKRGSGPTGMTTYADLTSELTRSWRIIERGHHFRDLGSTLAYAKFMEHGFRHPKDGSRVGPYPVLFPVIDTEWKTAIKIIARFVNGAFNA